MPSNDQQNNNRHSDTDINRNRSTNQNNSTTKLTNNTNKNNNNNGNNNHSHSRINRQHNIATNKNNNNNNNNNNIGISPTSLEITVPKKHKIPTPPERHIPRSVATILSGGLAGMIAKTFTAPLERVQMLNQTGATQSSIHRTLQTIFKENGILGLWRGNFANCVRVFPHKSILFTMNDILRAQFSSQLHSNSSSINFITGACAGGVATIATYPIDLIRAYMAGTFDKDSQSMFKVARKVYIKKGVPGLYTGLLVTLGGAVPYEACRIGVYNTLRAYIPTVPTNYGEEPHPIGKLLVGACAGATAGVVTYPTDTIRRMLQVQQANGMPKYSGVWDCVQSNYRRKGMRRFYRGLNAKLVRVIPDAAILFLAYEQLKDYFFDVHYIH